MDVCSVQVNQNIMAVLYGQSLLFFKGWKCLFVKGKAVAGKDLDGGALLVQMALKVRHVLLHLRCVCFFVRRLKARGEENGADADVASFFHMIKATCD